MSDPAYLKTCKCGNKWIADGKSICPPCNRARKDAKHVELAQKRAARQKARQERRMSKKNQNHKK
jgi:hypothetical protein